MTPEQTIFYANRAKEVIDNEAYQMAFETINNEILTQWTNAPARDTSGREDLWKLRSLLAKLQGTLEQMMQSGNLKAADLRFRQTMRERAQDWLR